MARMGRRPQGSRPKSKDGELGDAYSVPKVGFPDYYWLQITMWCFREHIIVVRPCAVVTRLPNNNFEAPRPGPTRVYFLRTAAFVPVGGRYTKSANEILWWPQKHPRFMNLDVAPLLDLLKPTHRASLACPRDSGGTGAGAIKLRALVFRVITPDRSLNCRCWEWSMSVFGALSTVCN